MVASFVFLTPNGGLAILALAIPLAGLAFAARRERQARELLRLEAPPRISRTRYAAMLVAVPVLLGLAATQPALRTTKSARVRTDAEAFFVIDISRSMDASITPTSPTRLARAKKDALELRDAIPQVPAGIATLTDRVVPDLFPNPDRNVFAQTLQQAVTIEQPPPVSSNVLATSFAALGSLGTQNFFDPSAKHRVVVVLTDGESVGFDAGTVAQQLAHRPGVQLVLVHVWHSTERVYDPNGSPETDYSPRPESAQTLESLATAAGGRWFGEGSIGSAARAVQAAAGTGPTKIQGHTERTQTLAPYVALLALLPLLFVLPRVSRGLGRALRVFVAGGFRRALEWKRHRSDYRTRVPEPGRQRT